MATCNIVIIVIDALRAAHLSCYGYHRATSPNIDDWAREGALFVDAYATTNATDPSLSTIISGKYPISHGIIHHGDMVKEEEIAGFVRGTKVLPEILKAEGYVTAAIDWLGRWHKRGYDYYYDQYLKGSTADLSKPQMFSYPDANEVTDQAIDFVRHHKNSNFFLFVHYWNTHTPYQSPKRYSKLFHSKSLGIEIDKMLGGIANSQYREYLQRVCEGAKTIDEITDRYDGCIAFIDHEIGRLVDFLRNQKLLDNTIMVLTSDHGESLTEHGIFFDHHSLYDASIHVPLIIRYPTEIPGGKTINGFVQHIDLVPTLLEMLSLELVKDLDGVSLLSHVNSQKLEYRSAIYAEETWTQIKGCLRTREYKYIFSRTEADAKCRYCQVVHGGIEELYDLNNDPLEILNIAKDNPAIVQEFRKELLHLREYWSKRAK